MWSDVLTKPKQGKGFRQDHAMLMNCAEEYDDDVEQQQTHPKLLQRPEGPVDPSTVTKTISAPSKPGNDRRSVLAVDSGSSGERRKRVTWNLPDGRSDMSDAELRKRHLELVMARAICGRNTRVNSQFRNTKENSFESTRANLARNALANLRSRNTGANSFR